VVAIFQGEAQNLGIGRDEVRGRHHLDELARVELQLLLRLVVQPFLLAGDLEEVFGGEEVRLLDEVEQGIVVPSRVLEAAIAAVGRDHGLDVDAQHALGRALPQPHVVLPQAELRLDQLVRLAHHAAEHLQESSAQRRMAVEAGAAAVGLAVACHEVLDQLAAAVGDLAQNRHDLLGLVGLGLRLFLLGHLGILYHPAAVRSTVRQRHRGA
jgi:hypothetical protein